MQKSKVFIDTNVINNPTPTGRLFGSGERLKCFDDRVDIIIPKIVYDELIEHKRRAFEKAKRRLLDNELLERIADIHKVELLEFCEPCVLFDEDITFKKIGISNYEDFCTWAFKLALRNEAPFDKTSDKGIKDAAVVFTIEEYLKKEKDNLESVILVSNDSRLGEYFQDRKDIVWVKSLEELEGRLASLIDNTGSAGNMASAKTTNSSDCDHVTTNSIIPSVQLEKARQLLTELRNSGNFATTHKIVAELLPYLKYLTDEDSVDILLSALNNDQIMWISNDQDIESFLKPIFDKYKDKLLIQQYNDFVSRTGWPDYRIKEPVKCDDWSDLPF